MGINIKDPKGTLHVRGGVGGDSAVLILNKLPIEERVDSVLVIHDNEVKKASAETLRSSGNAGSSGKSGIKVINIRKGLFFPEILKNSKGAKGSGKTTDQLLLDYNWELVSATAGSYTYSPCAKIKYTGLNLGIVPDMALVTYRPMDLKPGDEFNEVFITMMSEVTNDYIIIDLCRLDAFFDAWPRNITLNLALVNFDYYGVDDAAKEE